MSIDSAKNYIKTEISSECISTPSVRAPINGSHHTQQEAGWSLSPSTYFGSMQVRKGKWTAEEETYVKRIVKHFNSGLLCLPSGRSLRSLLSEKLHCDPMRITKKYSGQSCIGKQVFVPCEMTELNLRLIAECEKELIALEKQFFASLGAVDWTNEEADVTADLERISAAVDSLRGSSASLSSISPDNTSKPGHPSPRGPNSLRRKRPSNTSSDDLLAALPRRNDTLKKIKALHDPLNDKALSRSHREKHMHQHYSIEPCATLMNSDPGQVLISDRPSRLPLDVSHSGCNSDRSKNNTSDAAITAAPISDDEDTSAGILLWRFFQAVRSVVESDAGVQNLIDMTIKTGDALPRINQEGDAAATKRHPAVAAHRNLNPKRAVDVTHEYRTSSQPTKDNISFLDASTPRMNSGSCGMKVPYSTYHPSMPNCETHFSDAINIFSGRLANPSLQQFIHFEAPIVSNNPRFLPQQHLHLQPYMHRAYWQDVASNCSMPSHLEERRELSFARPSVIGELSVDLK